ncbi:MAG: type IV pilus modification protein PilV [Gammaproteobacteria bacterium]
MISRSNNIRSTHTAKGFSLIEVMVALALLAGALLGVAYMQNFSLQYGQESYHRSQIMTSANELIDGMRAMQIAPDDGTGNHTQYIDTITAGEATAGCDDTLSTARNDLICFAQEVSTNLPFGTVEVVVNPSDARFFDISVFWSDRGLSEQAGYSDADQTESSVNLNNKTDCDNATNRIWSDVLSWPFNNGPDADICMVAHTWSVQILNTSTL